eukprot:2859165-Rhodomonas_salina.4
MSGPETERAAVFLRSLDWSYIIVDEGHRLKNRESKLFTCLTGRNGYRAQNRVILSGSVAAFTFRVDVDSVVHGCAVRLYIDVGCVCVWMFWMSVTLGYPVGLSCVDMSVCLSFFSVSACTCA